MLSASLRSKPTNPGRASIGAEGLDPLATVRDRVVEPALVPRAGRGGIERAGEDHRVADGAREGERLVGRRRHSLVLVCAPRDPGVAEAKTRLQGGIGVRLDALGPGEQRDRVGDLNRRRRSRPSASLPRSPARTPGGGAAIAGALGDLARLPEQHRRLVAADPGERRLGRRDQGLDPRLVAGGEPRRLLQQLLRAGRRAAALGQLGGIDRRLVRLELELRGRREARPPGRGERRSPRRARRGARRRGRGPRRPRVDAAARARPWSGTSTRRRGSAGGGRRRARPHRPRDSRPGPALRAPAAPTPAGARRAH